MLEIKKETADRIFNALSQAVHPKFSWFQINNILVELQNLRPIGQEMPPLPNMEVSEVQTNSPEREEVE